MRKRLSISLFAYDPAMTIKETSLTRKRGMPRKKGRVVGGSLAKGFLSEYGYLTSGMIQRLLDNGGHREIMAEKTLRRLQEDGEVIKHTISAPGTEKPDIDVYSLSKDERERMRAAGREPIHFKHDMTNIPYILEKLSTAQWHIACQEVAWTREAAYNWRVALEDGRTAVMPSLTVRKNARGGKLYLCALSAPKGKEGEDLVRFLIQAYILKEYMSENPNRFRSWAFIIICEDDRQAEDVARYASGMKETAGMYLLFTNDDNTREGSDPLRTLYELSVRGGRIERRVISIA